MFYNFSVMNFFGGFLQAQMARTTMPNDHSALKEVSHKKVHKTKIVGHTNIVNFHKIVKALKNL